jgi:hypothetical protein
MLDFIAWWQAFDRVRCSLGLAPAAAETARWFFCRCYSPEAAADLDRRWLAGLGPVAMGEVR